ARFVDSLFQRLSASYERMLRHTSQRPVAVIILAMGAFVASLALLGKLPSEFMPREDRGFAMAHIKAPDGASLDYTLGYIKQAEKIMMVDKEKGDVLRVLGRSGSWNAGSDVNTGMVFAPLEVWSKRERSAQELASGWNRQFAELPGVQAYAFAPGAWAIGQSSRPLQVVLGGTNYEELAQWRDIVMDEAARLPGLSNLQSDYNERKPKIDVAVERDRAADLGVSLSNVGRTLETILGSRVVTTFIRDGEEYRVILQGADERRQTPSDLEAIYVRSQTSGALIPLSNLVRLTEAAGPVDLRRFDRMRSITISASLENNYSLGDALAELERIVADNLPESARLSYNGESRDFKATGRSIYVTFVLALAIAYLVLAAQFESFKHPLIIMTTVPLAVTGALIGLSVFGSTINIYSQIGVIMLIGLAAKNGILIVEFANQLRDRGEDYREAVIHSARTRLRPVLMTSMCTAFGSIPLLLATGAGALSRQSIGAVVFFGVSFSVLLTLVVVPAVYVLVAKNTHSPEYVSQLIDKLAASPKSRRATET
ncbi:MAG: efflux RND transporter permease subunit, partial [Gammaproteobacteria bacterium]|nr:efflux RND transporter permease subunit [Gammaproteobacteria bacterium]